MLELQIDGVTQEEITVSLLGMISGISSFPSQKYL
jgi:hypothetical protein